MESAIQKRLARLVEVLFGGNVYAASLATRIPQPTLQRLLEGTTVQPRIGTVKRIADGFGVPMAWLLGELSTEAAQEHAKRQPEPVWILLTYYRAAQQDMRAWLSAATAPTAEGKRIIEDFRDYSISPLDGDFPSKTFDAALFDGKQPDAYSLSLLKSCLELETEILANAARLARKVGGKTQTGR